MSSQEIKERTWTSIGGDLDASYDGSKYIDIRARPRAYIDQDDRIANSTRIFMSRENLYNALKLFPNNALYKIGDKIRCTMPAHAASNTPEMIDTGTVMALRTTIIERLILNDNTNKYEKQLTIEYSYDIHTDGTYDIDSQIPERWLTKIE